MSFNCGAKFHKLKVILDNAVHAWLYVSASLHLSPSITSQKAGNTLRILCYIFLNFCLHTSVCCILSGEVGTLHCCVDSLDSSACVTWIIFPSALFPEQWNHRLTWAGSMAPYSHRRGTHFMKTNKNNVTRTQNISFTAALLITFLSLTLCIGSFWASYTPTTTFPELFQSGTTENCHTNNLIRSKPEQVESVSQSKNRGVFVKCWFIQALCV